LWEGREISDTEKAMVRHIGKKDHVKTHREDRP